MSATVHWPRGGSNSDRIVACPGSVNEAAKYPAEPSGRAAIDGTHTHTLVEVSLRDRRPPKEYVGARLGDHEGEFVVDEARARRAEAAYNYVVRKLDEIPDLEVLTEQFYDTGSQFGIPQWGGSVDILLYSDSYFEVVDYKDGGKPVDPETYQLVTYALGASAELGIPDHIPTVVTVIQPKVFAEPNSVTYDPLTFDVKTKILTKAMYESLSPDAPRNAGDHCRYCPGAKPGRCDVYNQTAQEGVNLMNQSLSETSPGLPDALPLQLPKIGAQSTNEQLAAILDAEPLIKELLKEAHEEAVKRARNGQKIPGRKLIRGTSQRRWREGALETLSSMRVKASVYTESKLRSPKGVIESDAFRDLSETQQKKITDLVFKPEGALKLVPEADPGKAITFDPSEMFKDVPAPPKVQADVPPAPISFL